MNDGKKNRQKQPTDKDFEMEKSEIKKALTEIVDSSMSYETALHGISQYCAKNTQMGEIPEFVDIAITVLTNKFGVTE